jgi:hypothetical protein
MRSLSATDAAAFASGVAAMKALPKIDFRAWAYQAGVHGAPAADSAGVPDAPTYWNQCVHGGLHFLSWHRWELLFIEEIIRLMSGQCAFTLPYWDYIADGFLPASLRTPANAGNPLYDGTRSAALNNGTGALSGLSSAALNQTAFSSFSSTLYGNPHSAVHGQVSGNMGSVPTAARDPVFYLHHCNIDRYWECWLRLGGGRANPGSPWPEQTFPFRTASGRRNAVVGDCGRAADLGYTYENVSCGRFIRPDIRDLLRDLRLIRVRVRPPRPIPDPWPWRNVVAAEAIVLNGRPAAVVLPRRELTRSNLQSMAVAAKNRGAVVLQDLELSATARESGWFFEVWLVPDARALRSRNIAGAEMIGSFSSFDIPEKDSHASGEHAAPSAVILALPESSLAAVATGQNDVAILFIRRGLVDKDGQPLPIDRNAELVRIGAMRLDVAQ